MKGNDLQILVSKNHRIRAQGDMRESIMIKLRGLIIKSGENIEPGSDVNKNWKNIELVQTEETKFEGNAKIAQGKPPEMSRKFMTLNQRLSVSRKISKEGSKVLEVTKPTPSPAPNPFAYSNNTDPFPPTVIKEWASMTTAEFSKVREAARVIKVANASPKNNPRPFDFSGRKILNDALSYDAQLPPVNSKLRPAGYESPKNGHWPDPLRVDTDPGDESPLLHQDQAYRTLDAIGEEDDYGNNDPGMPEYLVLGLPQHPIEDKNSQLRKTKFVHSCGDVLGQNLNVTLDADFSNLGNGPNPKQANRWNSKFIKHADGEQLTPLRTDYQHGRRARLKM